MHGKWAEYGSQESWNNSPPTHSPLHVEKVAVMPSSSLPFMSQIIKIMFFAFPSLIFQASSEPPSWRRTPPARPLRRHRRPPPSSWRWRRRRCRPPGSGRRTLEDGRGGGGFERITPRRKTRESGGDRGPARHQSHSADKGRNKSTVPQDVMMRVKVLLLLLPGLKNGSCSLRSCGRREGGGKREDHLSSPLWNSAPF